MNNDIRENEFIIDTINRICTNVDKDSYHHYKIKKTPFFPIAIANIMLDIDNFYENRIICNMCVQLFRNIK